MNEDLDYQEVFDELPSAILILDENGVVLNINKRVSEWLDMKTKDLLGRSIFVLKKLPKESKLVVLEKFEKRMEGEDVEPYEIKFKGKNDQEYVGAVSATPLHDNKGNLNRILVVISDITHLKKGDNTTGFEDVVYRAIFQNSAIGIMIVDEKERVVDCNGFTEMILNKKRDELYHKSVKTLYPEEELEKFSKLNIRKEGKQSHLETKMLRGDNSLVDVNVSISALKDDSGEVIGSIGIIRDISKRIQAEGMAHESDMKYQMIFDSTAVGIMIVNEDEEIVSSNKYTEKLLGYSQDELKLKPLNDLYPKEELEKISQLNIRKDDLQSHVEIKMIKKDGGLLDAHLSISPLKDFEGKTTGSIGVIEDITERKIAEAEMLGAVQMKGQFLSMVSHELRTPLTAIRGSLDIIAEEAAGPINEEQKDFLNTALKNIVRLDKQISDVLDYQRLESGREKFTLAEGNINMILSQLETEISEQAKPKGLNLQFQLDNNIPGFSFDQTKMTRVFKNLLDNAIKFTDQGTIQVTSKLEGGQVAICVKDTGIGIGSDDMESLFEPFGQISTGDGRKTGNMGLGLVIARSIVKYHKGEIWVQSKTGEGSEFSVYLPINNE